MWIRFHDLEIKCKNIWGLLWLQIFEKKSWNNKQIPNMHKSGHCVDTFYCDEVWWWIIYFLSLKKNQSLLLTNSKKIMFFIFQWIPIIWKPNNLTGALLLGFKGGSNTILIIMVFRNWLLSASAHLSCVTLMVIAEFISSIFGSHLTPTLCLL